MNSLYNSIQYTFEKYNNASETRKWFERFLKEHNGSAPSWQVTDMVTAKFNIWVRIKYRGKLIAYARFHERKCYRVIGDVYVIPKHRKQGHYHTFFHDLAVFLRANCVCLVTPTLQAHEKFYAVILGWNRVMDMYDRGTDEVDFHYLCSPECFAERERQQQGEEFSITEAA